MKKWIFVRSKGQPKQRFCVPGSKSHTIRAVAIASLAEGRSIIRNPLISADTHAAVYTYRALGAEIDTSNPEIWEVNGTGCQITPPNEQIYVGNSGTTLRIAMGSAALATSGQTTILTGDKQIQTRPLDPLIEALNDLGANCTSLRNNGKAPVKIEGKIKGGRTSISATTSQYLSSLLLCTPMAPNDTEIDVTLLNEPGYVQMTLDWLDRQQIKYENDNMNFFRIKGGQKYTGFNRTIPADFSTATFFFCAAALLSDHEVKITGLDFSDSQPDKAVVDYLKKMGSKIRTTLHSAVITRRNLEGISIDMNNTPDALPAMAVTAAFAKGTTKLFNVPQARTKETDRIKCMAEELRKMAVDVEELPDGLIIKGGKTLKGADLDGRNDHRIVMALSMALLRIGHGTLSNVGAYTVTFPKFIDFVDSLGGSRIEPSYGVISSFRKKVAIVFHKIIG